MENLLKNSVCGVDGMTVFPRQKRVSKKLRSVSGSFTVRCSKTRFHLNEQSLGDFGFSPYQQG